MAPQKRKDFEDSTIMDALDACEYSIPKAAQRLGVGVAHFYNWIDKSPNLKSYIRLKLELDAVNAREKVQEIMQLDHNDPKFTGHVLGACKLLIDKADASKLQVDGTQSVSHTVDDELGETIRKLLGE